MVVKTREHFTSSDQKTVLGCNIWRDDSSEPIGVVQLVHGMAEYIDRYDLFARYLCSRGLAVVGGDHLGHGPDTAEADLGFFAEREGYIRLVEDERHITGLARERFPGLKLALFGHSMGSFMARAYAARWPGEFDALVICGTSGPNPLGGLGLALVDLIALFRGERHRSVFINAMAFGSYNRRIKGAVSPFDWLSADRENVERYLADPLCGFTFTLSGFRDLFKLLAIISDEGWAGRLCRETPVLLISGADDPVGGYGKGVEQVRSRLEKAGIADLTLRLYEGARHEILNDNCRERVMADCGNWLLERLG